jgi:hypothetical protein
MATTAGARFGILEQILIQVMTAESLLSTGREAVSFMPPPPQ